MAVLTINRHLCGLNRANSHKASFKFIPLSLPRSYPLKTLFDSFSTASLIRFLGPSPLSPLPSSACDGRRLLPPPPLPGVASAAPLGHSYSPLWHGGCGGGSPSPVSTCFSLRSGSYSPLPGWWQR